jgi:hypothetical protein
MWQNLFRSADLITRLSQSLWSPYLDESLPFSASNITAPARFGVLSCRQIISPAGCQSGSSLHRIPMDAWPKEIWICPTEA